MRAVVPTFNAGLGIARRSKAVSMALRTVAFAVLYSE